MAECQSAVTNINQYLQMMKHVSDRNKACLNFKGESDIDKLLANGRFYNSELLTPEEWNIFLDAANIMFEKHESDDFEIKQCFFNSQYLISCDLTNSLKYVEGFANIFIPIHHGWVVINNKVIDVTARLQKSEPVYKRRKFKDRAIGEFPSSRAYFGMEFSKQAIFKQMTKGYLGSFLFSY